MIRYRRGENATAYRETGMKRFSLTAAAVLLSLFGAAPGWASVPVVGVDWLLANGASEGRAIVDLRDKRSYLGAHIPGAVHTDYGLDGWRVRRTSFSWRRAGGRAISVSRRGSIGRSRCWATTRFRYWTAV